MRTGRPTERGFTYLAVLFLVALTAAGLAALGKSWSTAAQREREAELEFRGQAIANAIASYQRASTSGVPELPRGLDDLLLDRRSATPRVHLRQRYTDPFTGQADWVLVADRSNPQSFSALHSRADQPLLRERSRAGQVLRIASDWVFTPSPLDGRLGASHPTSTAASAPI